MELAIPAPQSAKDASVPETELNNNVVSRDLADLDELSKAYVL